MDFAWLWTAVSVAMTGHFYFYFFETIETTGYLSKGIFLAKIEWPLASDEVANLAVFRFPLGCNE